VACLGLDATGQFAVWDHVVDEREYSVMSPEGGVVVPLPSFRTGKGDSRWDAPRSLQGSPQAKTRDPGMDDFESDWYPKDRDKPRGRVWRILHSQDGELVGAGPLWLWLVLSALTVAGLVISLVELFDDYRRVSESIGYVALLIGSLAGGWFSFRTVGERLFERGRDGWGIAAGCLSLVLGFLLLLLVFALVTA
jgi:hypothetical protein